MIQRTYHELLDEIPSLHLVIARVRTKDRLRAAEDNLVTLVIALEPKAQWSVGHIRGVDGYKIHCVFERQEDADRLADAVGATAVHPDIGFQSRRSFALDAAARKAITSTLQKMSWPNR
jgi:hypothetical protein